MSRTARYFITSVLAMVSVYPAARFVSMSQEPDSKQTQKNQQDKLVAQVKRANQSAKTTGQVEALIQKWLLDDQVKKRNR